MMENTLEMLVSTVVMSVCTEEMKVSTRHQENMSEMLGSMRLLPNNEVSSANMMGWLVNTMEM